MYFIFDSGKTRAMKREIQIDVNQVTMRYAMNRNRIMSIKEYVVSRVKGTYQMDTFSALEGISFCVRRGEVLGIIGRNGAGKSTLLKVISGILRPTEGSVYVKGSIAPMLELGSGFDQDLTGYENIFLNGAILGYSKEFLKSRFEEIVKFSELGEFIYAPLRTYSSGMMMRLAFSIAAVVVPEVLIVDEILSVGDASFQEKSRRRMKELMGGGTTVLFVSHEMQQVKMLCQRVLWLEHGRMVGIGPAEEICRQYEAS